MKSAFDANVPKRKPRTRLGTMLADLDTPAEADPEVDEPVAEPAAAAKAVERKAPAPRAKAKKRAKTSRAAAKFDAAAKASRSAPKIPEPEVADTPDPVALDEAAASEVLPATELRTPTLDSAAEVTTVPALASQTPSGRPRHEAPGSDIVQAGRSRIEALRRRLAAAERARQPALEPEVTAGRVRDTVGQLKARLDEVLGERQELLQTLESTRQSLAEGHLALQRERDDRVAADTLAEERGRVAEELMAESEALADERDRALARIAELQLLDAEQARLLEDMESGLADRDAELTATRTRAEALRQGLEAAQAELVVTQSQLEDETDRRVRADRRIAELEAQLTRAEEARTALSEIQRLVDGVG